MRLRLRQLSEYRKIVAELTRELTRTQRSEEHYSRAFKQAGSHAAERHATVVQATQDNSRFRSHTQSSGPPGDSQSPTLPCVHIHDGCSDLDTTDDSEEEPPETGCMVAGGAGALENRLPEVPSVFDQEDRAQPEGHPNRHAWADARVALLEHRVTPGCLWR